MKTPAYSKQRQKNNTFAPEEVLEAVIYVGQENKTVLYIVTCRIQEEAKQEGSDLATMYETIADQKISGVNGKRGSIGNRTFELNKERMEGKNRTQNNSELPGREVRQNARARPAWRRGESARLSANHTLGDVR